MIFRFPAATRSAGCRASVRVCAAALLLVAAVRLSGEDAGERIYPQGTLSLASLASQMEVAGGAELMTTTAAAGDVPTPAPVVDFPESTNVPSAVPKPSSTVVRPGANGIPVNIADALSNTNDFPSDMMSQEELVAHLNQRLEVARFLRTRRQARDAEPLLVELLAERAPESIKQLALLELAAAAQDQNDLPRSQQIYAQFLSKWANDLRVPEVLLRQGMLYRQMGLYNLSFTKFYAVMTSALALKNDQFAYYVRLVQEAQTQIAETHYELGKYAEAADFFSRLLKQNNPTLDKPQVLYKLTRCHSALGRYAEAVSEAQDFLGRFPSAPQQPEVRFHLALALKELGRNNESLEQVLLLLREQREKTRERPAVWAYWQQRTGNLIANQLYQEGDYARALEIYLDMTQLERSITWQVPLNYQIAMTYERLWQPQRAIETYNEILSHEKELGTNTPAGLKTIFEMSRWRIQFVQWQGKAETANRQLRADATNTAVTASLPASTRTIP